ncbi:unnamed protein product [Tilletia controversa]|nr:unnamed protein product [Tilletia controversa]CAD6929989.1 unnamed protein product [Tilletia controversa]CAD6938022.1 unnamed protein product [Tilletia controversa]
MSQQRWQLERWYPDPNDNEAEERRHQTRQRQIQAYQERLAREEVEATALTAEEEAAERKLERKKESNRANTARREAERAAAVAAHALAGTTPATAIRIETGDEDRRPGTARNPIVIE